jgi:hypothetical protein
MTKKEAIEEMKTIQSDRDIEGAHINADALLCKLLVELGFSDVVAEYKKIEKWYA